MSHFASPAPITNLPSCFIFCVLPASLRSVSSEHIPTQTRVSSVLPFFSLPPRKVCHIDPSLLFFDPFLLRCQLTSVHRPKLFDLPADNFPHILPLCAFPWGAGRHISWPGVRYIFVPLASTFFALHGAPPDRPGELSPFTPGPQRT